MESVIYTKNNKLLNHYVESYRKQISNLKQKIPNYESGLTYDEMNKLTPVLEHKKYYDETINNNTVTVRDRDTMEQVRVSIDELVKWIDNKIEF